MAKQTPKEQAERITQRILTSIEKKTDQFEKAEKKNDWEGMIDNKLSKSEQKFLETQRKLDINAGAEEQTESLLEEAELKDLQEIYDALRNAPGN